MSLLVAVRTPEMLLHYHAQQQHEALKQRGRQSAGYSLSSRRFKDLKCFHMLGAENLYAFQTKSEQTHFRVNFKTQSSANEQRRRRQMLQGFILPLLRQ